MPKNKSEKNFKIFIKYRGMRRINEINKPAKLFSTKIRIANKFIKNTVTKGA